MTRARVAPLAAVLLAGCAAGRLSSFPTPGCERFDRTRDVVELRAGERVSVPQPCPTLGVSRFASPITLTAQPDGLRIEFAMGDQSFVPGALRQETGQRDAVVVYPQGEGPARPVVELGSERAPGGYRVDDVIPWESWGLRGPDGDLTLRVSVFDREKTGAEAELRLRYTMRVRPTP